MLVSKRNTESPIEFCVINRCSALAFLSKLIYIANIATFSGVASGVGVRTLFVAIVTSYLVTFIRILQNLYFIYTI